MKKKATIKLNGGAGAILCSCCNIIIKTGRDFTEEEMKFFNGEIKFLSSKYCDNCKNKYQ